MKAEATISVRQAKQLARRISGQLTGGEILGLVGPLGSGKTTFVKHLAKSFHVRTRVASPTFIIMNRYQGKLGRKPVALYHLDLYRCKNFAEVAALGILDIWGQAGTVTAIEWADKIKKHLPKKTRLINFELSRHEN